jgi:hypothetical protein
VKNGGHQGLRGEGMVKERGNVLVKRNKLR